MAKVLVIKALLSADNASRTNKLLTKFLSYYTAKNPHDTITMLDLNNVPMAQKNIDPW